MRIFRKLVIHPSTKFFLFVLFGKPKKKTFCRHLFNHNFKNNVDVCWSMMIMMAMIIIIILIISLVLCFQNLHTIQNSVMQVHLSSYVCQLVSHFGFMLIYLDSTQLLNILLLLIHLFNFFFPASSLLLLLLLFTIIIT